MQAQTTSVRCAFQNLNNEKTALDPNTYFSYKHLIKLTSYIATMNTETQLNTLRYAPEANSQQNLAKKLGFSLGKTNYVLKGVIAKGWIKAERFINSDNKAGYRYVLTPSGVKARIELTEAFIERKKQEYEELQQDLKQLKTHNNV